MEYYLDCESGLELVIILKDEAPIVWLGQDFSFGATTRDYVTLFVIVIWSTQLGTSYPTAQGFENRIVT
jgi:hypothetical protein